MKLLIVAIILATGQLVMATDEKPSELPWGGHIIDYMGKLIYGKQRYK